MREKLAVLVLVSMSADERIKEDIAFILFDSM